MISGSSGSVLDDLPYLGSTLLVSLVAVSVAVDLTSRLLQVRLATLGCALLVAGMALGAASGIEGVGASELSLLADIAQGGGVGAFFIAWGCLYVRAETEAVECAFLGWFPLLIVLLAAVAGINLVEGGSAVLQAGLLLVLPFASLVCFRKSMRLVDASESDQALSDLGTQEVSGEDVSRGESRKNIVFPLVNLAFVFASTSLAWNAILSCAPCRFLELVSLFAVGIAALLVIVWVALRTTRHFSLLTLYRWALPLFAAGAVLYQLSPAECFALVFLCLSIVNTGFEVMGKLFCIYLAKRNPRYAGAVIAVGFAAASLGGILGSCAWAGVLGQFGPDAAGDTLLVALVAFVFAASCALGVNYDTRGALQRRGPESECDAQKEGAAEDRVAAKCALVAGQYGLSSREFEVLALLAQGRSRAHIRETLYISKGTVDSHIHHIYSKMGISSKDELMRRLLD